LALRHRLLAMGVRGTVMYGARKNPDAAAGIDAHAWLRVGGEDYDPSADTRGTFSEFRSR
jgi:hypothetical protein